MNVQISRGRKNYEDDFNLPRSKFSITIFIKEF